MACRMVGANPLSEPMGGILLICPSGINLSEISIEMQPFSLMKCIWACRLRNGGHFVSAWMCQQSWPYSLMLAYNHTCRIEIKKQMVRTQSLTARWLKQNVCITWFMSHRACSPVTMAVPYGLTPLEYQGMRHQHDDIGHQHGPLARYVKLRVRMLRECRDRFPRHRR